MPNWCENDMNVFGEKRMLDKFYNDMIDASSGNPKDFESVTTDFGKEWLGNLFLQNYKTIDALNKNKVSCRGRVLYISKEEDYIDIAFESAWSPIINTWDDYLKKFYPGLNEVSFIEETGNNIYINTDIDGTYFPDRYKLVFVDGTGEYHENYFKSLELINDWLLDFLKSADLKDIDDACIYEYEYE